MRKKLTVSIKRRNQNENVPKGRCLKVAHMYIDILTSVSYLLEMLFLCHLTIIEACETNINYSKYQTYSVSIIYKYLSESANMQRLGRLFCIFLTLAPLLAKR